MNQLTKSDILRLKRALPSGGITRITEQTGEEYQLVYRTLSGQIKKWDIRHDGVISSAQKLLEDVAIKLS